MSQAARATTTQYILALFLIAWASLVGAWFYPSPSPYRPLGGDSVTPAVLRAGEPFTVVRRYEITRDGPIYVTRAMRREDCSKRCEIIDLPSGWLDLSRGQYHVSRDQAVPVIAEPGIWHLVYAVHWDDLLGRRQKYLLPPLSVEVVK